MDRQGEIDLRTEIPWRFVYEGTSERFRIVLMSAKEGADEVKCALSSFPEIVVIGKAMGQMVGGPLSLPGLILVQELVDSLLRVELQELLSVSRLT